MMFAFVTFIYAKDGGVEGLGNITYLNRLRAYVLSSYGSNEDVWQSCFTRSVDEAEQAKGTRSYYIRMRIADLRPPKS